MSTTAPPKLLRYADLVEMGIVSNRTTLYRWIRKGHFPAPIQIGPNSLAWYEHRVTRFLARCERDG